MSATTITSLTFLGSLILLGTVQTYEVPSAIIEILQPKGLKASIPDEKGITRYAFHGRINEEFEQTDEGQFSDDVLKPRNGFWTYTNRDIKLNIGDIIHYWIYVVKDGLEYERVSLSYEVKGFDQIENSTGNSRPNNGSYSINTSHFTRENESIENWNPNPSPNCSQSITTVNGEPACSGHLIFETNFTDEIGENWTIEVHSNYDESEFVVFDNNTSNSFSNYGLLNLQPALLDEFYGEGFTLKGSLDLSDRCTSREQICELKTSSFSILPPVISARLTTDSSFSFKYGILEMKAKLPRGDWVIPELWLQPKRHRYGYANSGTVILAKSIGNTLLTLDGEKIGNNLLTCGLKVKDKGNTFQKSKDSGLWSDDFHIFRLEWTDDKISFSVDNEHLGDWDGKSSPLLEGFDTLSPFDQEFYILLGIHVGGYLDIPDGALNNGRSKPWRNTDPKRMRTFYEDLNNWHASWSDRTKLQIDFIRVWAI